MTQGASTFRTFFGVPVKNQSAEQVLKRLMEAYDAYDEATLSVKLNRDIATLRTWLSRDKVPLQILVEASRATDYSVDWLKGEPGAKKTATKKTPADDRAAAWLTAREADLLDRYRRLPEKLRQHIDDAALIAVLAHSDRKGQDDAVRSPP